MNVMEKVLKEKIDPALTVGNLSALGSRALGRQVEAVEASVLTGGCWNRVIAVSFHDEPEELVFKISPQERNAGIEREYAVLSFFTEDTDMPVPTPRLLDASGRIIPGTVLVMDRIPGRVLHHLYGLLGRTQRDAVSEQLGHFVGRLHQNRSRGFGGVELAPHERQTAWADFWLPRFDNVMREMTETDLLPPSFLEEVTRVRSRFPALLDIGAESTLTHYDIWSGNVMVNPNGSSAQITGFIDVPGHWADYARELSFMEMFGTADRRFYEVYAGYHALDEGFSVRKNVYNLKMHLKHISMYPDQSYYRQGARACLTYIQRFGA